MLFHPGPEQPTAPNAGVLRSSRARIIPGKITASPRSGSS